jgi:methylmalonyl-CoA epimerase
MYLTIGILRIHCFCGEVFQYSNQGKERKMKVTKLDHIGIAVKNMDDALAFYRDTLGISSVGTEVIEEQKVKIAFLPLGGTELELLESTSPDGPVAKFIEKRGEGIQHIALRVENIEEALKELKEKDFKLIDQQPRYGAGNAKIAFLHPKATGGILLEISERE